MQLRFGDFMFQFVVGFFISNLDLHLYIYSHAVYTPRTSAVNWVE